MLILDRYSNSNRDQHVYDVTVSVNYIVEYILV